MADEEERLKAEKLAAAKKRVSPVHDLQFSQVADSESAHN